MIANKKDRLTVLQSIYIALILLIVYYPLILYVNIPFSESFLPRWILVFMAFTNFTFYVPLLLIFDRVVDWVESRFNFKVVTSFSIPTLLFCVLFAGSAVIFSNVFHAATAEPIGRAIDGDHVEEEWRKKDEKTRQLEETYWNDFMRINNAFKFLIALSIFYLTINRKANIRMKDLALQTEQLQKEHALAQFEALKSQVSPHFLFNSLSILSSLVHIDQNLSEKFIDQLSKAYRYILEQKDNDSISLKTELDFIRSYAFLLKIRFEEKFDLQIDVTDSDANHYYIAPLTLQMLIENAVKHNRMSASEPLHVSIRKDGECLVIENPIQRLQTSESMPSTGIGLKNIVNRYKLLTRESVDISQSDNVFRVKIPLLS